MLGQHIFLQYTEGYFSRPNSNGSSSTVTISRNMFAEEEQARLAARECEVISALEDFRPVPSRIKGMYRGVLKIKKLNDQITVVCRAYRLRGDLEEMGAASAAPQTDFREFTFGSSYLLTGEERSLFFEKPEYCLNVRSFEQFPSVQRRIAESRAQGNYGGIEANPEYTLFPGRVQDMPPDAFVRAGFTRDLFASYISSLFELIAYKGCDGYRKDKVLVILPEKYRPDWAHSGGNSAAEAIITATLKVLPEFISSQISTVSCGGRDPDAGVLDGYQLVFMEGGLSEEWLQNRYSIIDLDRGMSYVTRNLYTAFGVFLWGQLQNGSIEKDFYERYVQLLGKERAEDGESLQLWTVMAQRELQDVQRKHGGGSRPWQETRAFFRKNILRQNPENVFQLREEQIYFLKTSIGISSADGVLWGNLDALYSIYYDDAMDMGTWDQVHETILNSPFAGAYLFPLESRRTREIHESASRTAYMEGAGISGFRRICAFAMLEEQISQRMQNRRFHFDSAWKRTLLERSHPGDPDVLRTAVTMLSVTNGKRLTGYAGVEDVLRRVIWSIAETKNGPELFCSEDLAGRFALLNDQTRASLNLSYYLAPLNRYWHDRYGIRDTERTGGAAPIAGAAVLLLILGIGLQVLFFLIYDRLPYPVPLILGLAFVTVGIIGSIAAVITMLLDKRRQRKSPRYPGNPGRGWNGRIMPDDGRGWSETYRIPNEYQPYQKNRR